MFDGEKDLGNISVSNSKTLEVAVYTKGFLQLPLTKDEVENIVIKNDFKKHFEAPIKKNQVVGVSKIMLNNEVLMEMDIVTKSYAEIFDIISVAESILNCWFELTSKNKFNIDLRSIVQ